MGGCGIWLSNIIVEEVIEVDELEEGSTEHIYCSTATQLY